jgi:hypothetical protein
MEPPLPSLTVPFICAVDCAIKALAHNRALTSNLAAFIVLPHLQK